MTPVLGVRVPNVPGGLAMLLEFLDEQDANIEYGYCFSVNDEYAIDVLKVDGDDRIEEQLTDAGFEPGDDRKTSMNLTKQALAADCVAPTAATRAFSWLASLVLALGVAAFACSVPAHRRRAQGRRRLRARSVDARGLSVAQCPNIDAEYALVMDADGTVYFERNAHEPDPDRVHHEDHDGHRGAR